MNQLIFSFALILITSYMNAQTLSPFEKNEKWGYKDSKGKEIIVAQFDYAMEFNEKGIAPVVDESGWWYIDKKGNKLIQPMVVENGPDYFHEGLSRFVKDGKVGFFDESGKVIVLTEYEYVNPFFNGRAAVNIGGHFVQMDEYKLRKGGKWGFIDKTGKLVIPAIYDYANDFENGKSAVTKDGEIIYIDTNGKVSEGVINDLPPTQEIMGGSEATAEYASECRKEFSTCMEELFYHTSIAVLTLDSVPTYILEKADSCQQQFFQSMKGGINLTMEQTREMCRKHYKKQKACYKDILLFKLFLESKNLSVKVGNPVKNPGEKLLWDTQINPAWTLTVNDQTTFYVLPIDYYQTNRQTSFGNEPTAAMVSGITNHAIFFLPQEDDVVLELVDAIKSYFGEQELLDKENDNIMLTRKYKHYAQVILKKPISDQEITKLKNKYKVETLIINII